MTDVGEKMYRVEKNGKQNIAKQEPGRAQQVSKGSNKVHQTAYKPLFSTLYNPEVHGFCTVLVKEGIQREEKSLYC